MGVARYRAGQWEEAVAALEKAMRLSSGGDAGDWLFLALAHWQLGHKDKAGAYYQKAARWMDQKRPERPELRRFRAEAAALLGITDGAQDPAKDKPAPKL
jgi:uncharacterized protein HemY